MMLMWNTVRRRIESHMSNPWKVNTEQQCLAAMPLMLMDSFFYTGPCRNARNVWLRRDGSRWMIDFDHFTPKDSSDHTGAFTIVGGKCGVDEHFHASQQWLGDLLSVAGGWCLEREGWIGYPFEVDKALREEEQTAAA